MGDGIGRRTVLGTAAVGVAALAGCSTPFSSRTPPHGSVAAENDGDQPYEVTTTVRDGAEVLLDHTFAVDAGELEATGPIIEHQGTYEVRAEIDGETWESRIAFERDGPDGEEIYGYILLYVTGPPTDLWIGGPPDGEP